MSVLLLFEILGLFVNALAADDKYSLSKRNNLQQVIQIPLSNQKKKIKVLAAFLKSKSNFTYFFKKDEPYSLCISEIGDCKRRG